MTSRDNLRVGEGRVAISREGGLLSGCIIDKGMVADYFLFFFDCRDVKNRIARYEREICKCRRKRFAGGDWIEREGKNCLALTAKMEYFS